VFDRWEDRDAITDFIPGGCLPECEGSDFSIAVAAPRDRIVLKRGTIADIEAAVAGVTSDEEGNAVVRYGGTDMSLPDTRRPEEQPVILIPGGLLATGRMLIMAVRSNL
jgi:hypothetical protein